MWKHLQDEWNEISAKSKNATDSLTPDSPQKQTPVDPTTASFAFSATKVATVRT
jgi:hypothetical protein